MTISRNVAARIVKLEARRHRSNEILLVWRRPDEDVSDAISKTEFASGDRVICAEWFGDGPLPAPRWYRNRVSSELGAIENEYLAQSLMRLADGYKRDLGFADMPHVLPQRIVELSDNDLLHLALGVAT